MGPGVENRLLDRARNIRSYLKFRRRKEFRSIFCKRHKSRIFYLMSSCNKYSEKVIVSFYIQITNSSIDSDLKSPSWCVF